MMNIEDLRKGEHSEIEGKSAVDLRNELLRIYSKSHICENNINKLNAFTPDGYFITRQDYNTLMLISFKMNKTIKEMYEIGRTLDGQIALSFGEDIQLYIPNQLRIKEFMGHIEDKMKSR